MKTVLRISSILLMVFAYFFGRTSWDGYCFGDEVLKSIGMNTWSNGTTGSHYASYIGIGIMLLAIYIFATTTKNKVDTIRCFMYGWIAVLLAVNIDNWLLIVPLAALFYLLYINGILVLSNKRAAVFVGSIRGKERCSARFCACSGQMRRVFRFEESMNYHFTFTNELSEGTLRVEVLDGKKNKLLVLDSDQSEGNIEVDKKKRYYLVFRFQSATGSYELAWKGRPD